MGRSAKYPTVPHSSNAGIVIPVGSTAQRESAPADGTIRYNTDTTKFELYQNSAWINPTSRGNVTITKDTYSGDGSTAAFGPMSIAPASDQAVQVFVGNVHQNPTVAYTISTTTITFSTPPNIGQSIEILHGFDSTDV